MDSVTAKVHSRMMARIKDEILAPKWWSGLGGVTSSP
jgi:hypothetical protein